MMTKKILWSTQGGRVNKSDGGEDQNLVTFIFPFKVKGALIAMRRIKILNSPNFKYRCPSDSKDPREEKSRRKFLSNPPSSYQSENLVNSFDSQEEAIIKTVGLHSRNPL